MTIIFFQNPARLLPYSIMQNPVNDIQKMDTSVLLMMITALSAYYGRRLTDGELSASARTIAELQYEIDSRKKIGGSIPV